MKTITIAEAREMSGMPIPRITGKVKMIWERKTGKNDNGDWSMQSGILTDGESEIKFTLSSFGEFPYKQGQTVIFRCKDGKKGLTGVKVKTDDYKGKSEPVLWVTPSAIVVSDEEESDDIPMSFDQKGSPIGEEPPKNAPQANVAPKKAIPANGVQEVKKAVMQLANLRQICDDSAAFLYPEGDKDFVKEIATSIYIQATRDGLHHKLPNNKPISNAGMDKEAAEDMARAMGDKDLF